jgi:hypothetical protein
MWLHCREKALHSDAYLTDFSVRNGKDFSHVFQRTHSTHLQNRPDVRGFKGKAPLKARLSRFREKVIIEYQRLMQ